MQNIAQVIVDGNLTADPEIRKTNSEKTVANFRMATNHDWGAKNGHRLVSYFPVECWERLAENCGRYLKKGSRVTVQGELREDRWIDPEGKNRSRVKIMARSVRFDSPATSKGSQEPQRQEQERDQDQDQG